MAEIYDYLRYKIVDTFRYAVNLMQSYSQKQSWQIAKVP